MYLNFNIRLALRWQTVQILKDLFIVICVEDYITLRPEALGQFQGFVKSYMHSSPGWWAVIPATVQPGRETSIRK